MHPHSSKPVPSLAIPLSCLIRDNFVSAAFRRAERDNGSAPELTVPRLPILVGGEAA
jgi:hypothetical protein